MKRPALTLLLLLALLLALTGTAFAQAFPSTAVLDSFTRADGDVTTGSSWITWPLINANFSVLSNQAGHTAANVGSLFNVSHGPDVEYYVTIKTLPGEGSGFSITWRQSTTTTTDTRYYIDVNRVAGASNDTIGVGKAVTGTYTENIGGVISLGVDLAVNDVIGIRMVGDTVTVYRNSASVGTRTDSSITTAGLSGLFVADATVRLDDYGGGTFVPASTTIPRVIGGGVSYGRGVLD